MNLDALIFVPALVGSVVFGFVFALFASNGYLTVLQSTGSGAKFVTWVREPILDSFWKVFYLAWLIGLWLGPAYFLGRALSAGSDGSWLRLAIPLTFFWLVYPVSQLSSLSGPTIWLPLHPDVLNRLAQRPRVVIGFLGLSALTLGGFGLSFYWVFQARALPLLVVGSLLFVLFGLLYARLLGRLAFVLAFTRPFLKRKKKKKASTDATTADAIEPGRETVQPCELPSLHTPHDGPLTGYNFQVEDAPRTRIVAELDETPEPAPELQPQSQVRATPHPERSRAWTEEDEDRTPYGVGAVEEIADEAAPSEVIKPSAEEIRLISREDAPRRPKKAWTGEVLAFLAQPETLAAWLMLSGMCGAVGGMIRIARAFNPAAGDS